MLEEAETKDEKEDKIKRFRKSESDITMVCTRKYAVAIYGQRKNRLCKVREGDEKVLMGPRCRILTANGSFVSRNHISAFVALKLGSIRCYTSG
jgi:hypothetical protein